MEIWWLAAAANNEHLVFIPLCHEGGKATVSIRCFHSCKNGTLQQTLQFNERKSLESEETFETDTSDMKLLNE